MGWREEELLFEKAEKQVDNKEDTWQTWAGSTLVAEWYRDKDERRGLLTKEQSTVAPTQEPEPRRRSLFEPEAEASPEKQAQLSCMEELMQKKEADFRQGIAALKAMHQSQMAEKEELFRQKEVDMSECIASLKRQLEEQDLKEVLAELKDDWKQLEKELVSLCCCPISHELMEHPTLAADGRSYEAESIRTWISLHGTSPFTRQPMHSQPQRNRLAEQLCAVLRRFFPEAKEGAKSKDLGRPQGASELGLGGRGRTGLGPRGRQRAADPGNGCFSWTRTAPHCC